MAKLDTKNQHSKGNPSKNGASKSAVRSRAYPAVDLRTAIQLAGRQVQALGWGGHDRNAIAQALGHAKTSGPAARKIAAMSHYGLLERRQGLYKPTQLARRLIETNDLSTLRTARREAFLNPALFRDLYDIYRPIGRIPTLLGSTLARDHGISESAQEDVASIFRESGHFAAVLDADGYFEGPRPVPVDPTRGVEAVGTAMHEAAPAKSNRETPKALQDEPYMRLQLTHGPAELHLPSQLTPTDLRLLKLQLDIYAQDHIEENRQPASSKLIRRDFGK